MPRVYMYVHMYTCDDRAPRTSRLATGRLARSCQRCHSVSSEAVVALARRSPL